MFNFRHVTELAHSTSCGGKLTLFYAFISLEIICHFQTTGMHQLIGGKKTKKNKNKTELFFLVKIVKTEQLSYVEQIPHQACFCWCMALFIVFQGSNVLAPQRVYTTDVFSAFACLAQLHLFGT